jgi:hypothetical protein
VDAPVLLDEDCGEVLYQVRDNYWPSFTFFPFKVIYLIRNPRDVLVSGYFFWANTNLVKNLESLGIYFEQFLKGNGE